MHIVHIPRLTLLTALYVISHSTVTLQAFASEPNSLGSNRGGKILNLSMEEKFKEAPPELVTTLSKSGANKDFLDGGCKKYVGRNIPVSNTQGKIVWLVTTPGCGWGAHTAPIWVIEKSPEGGKLLLNSGGIGFEVLSKSQNGYRDIVTSDGSAGYYMDTHYKFTGKSYIKFASRFVELTDPDACKKLPDILECN